MKKFWDFFLRLELSNNTPLKDFLSPFNLLQISEFYVPLNLSEI